MPFDLYTSFPVDAVPEIKARLPIEELVSKYVTLQKKGRSFVGLCPFHNDKRPSLLVSPDKGLAYCFACQKGGDIFSFYQQIEGCDFRQALRDLAERAGVKIEEHMTERVPKDERERIRACLHAALAFFSTTLTSSNVAEEYLKKREVDDALRNQFELGFAPDSFSATYDALLKLGFSRKEIVAAGLGIQKDLREERIYDRFRNRLMFPIHDHQGNIVGFGGRTLGSDDAKYVNSSEGILYHKSNVLYGLHHAKEAIRSTKQVVLVEGYFDVLACHRVGVTNAVAVSGTALTDQHVTLLKRNAESAVLCLDQDRAGQEAAERAFAALSAQGMQVLSVTLPHKDPDETAHADPTLLQTLLSTGPKPYLESVLDQIRQLDLRLPVIRRQSLLRILGLLSALPMAVERTEYLAKTAATFGTTESALQDDLRAVQAQLHIKIPEQSAAKDSFSLFSSVEITLGLLLLHPAFHLLLSELIPPEEGFAANLFAALKKIPAGEKTSSERLELSKEDLERAGILELFCEHHGFSDWSEGLAAREIRKNIQAANRDQLRTKQRELSQKLIDAKKGGRLAEEAQLSTQYQQILKLAKMAR